jgi:hypothetical protein
MAFGFFLIRERNQELADPGQIEPDAAGRLPSTTADAGLRVMATVSL